MDRGWSSHCFERQRLEASLACPPAPAWTQKRQVCRWCGAEGDQAPGEQGLGWQLGRQGPQGSPSEPLC